MKRGAVILVVVFSLGTAMGILSYRFSRDRISPVDWLRKEFSLNEEQSARVVVLNAEYGPQCSEWTDNARRLYFQCEGICILLTPPPNAKWQRNHRIDESDARLIKQVGHRNRVTACGLLGAAAT